MRLSPGPKSPASITMAVAITIIILAGCRSSVQEKGILALPLQWRGAGGGGVMNAGVSSLGQSEDVVDIEFIHKLKLESLGSDKYWFEVVLFGDGRAILYPVFMGDLSRTPRVYPAIWMISDDGDFKLEWYSPKGYVWDYKVFVGDVFGGDGSVINGVVDHDIKATISVLDKRNEVTAPGWRFADEMVVEFSDPDVMRKQLFKIKSQNQLDMNQLDRQ